jgi:hypothetical protein
VAYQGYTLTGTITFTQSTITASTSETYAQTLEYTNACIAALNADSTDFPNVPQGPASVNTCSMIADLLADSLTTVNCPYADNSCNCTLDLNAPSVVGTSSYKVDKNGTQYVDETTDPNGDYPVYFCVGGGTLTTAQLSPSGQMVEHVLTRQSP